MAVALVNTRTGSAGASDTVNCGAFAATTGNLIVVGIRTGSAATINSISDTASNTYIPVGTVFTDVGRTWVFYAKNITGNATNVVTANLSSGDFTGVVVHEYSGAAKSAPLDNFTRKSSLVGGTSISSDPWDVAQDGVVFSFATQVANPVYTAGSGYTLSGNDGSNGAQGQYKINSAGITGEVTSMSSNANANWAIWAVSFRGTTYLLPMGTGTFTFTGVAATFVRIFPFLAATGSFILTGMSALFRFTGWTPAEYKNAASWDPNEDKEAASWTYRQK